MGDLLGAGEAAGRGLVGAVPVRATAAHIDFCIFWLRE